MLLRAAVLGLLLAISCSLSAAEVLSVMLGDIGNDEWYARDVVLELNFSSDQDHFKFSASEIAHPALTGPIKSFIFDCKKGLIKDRRIECQQGSADLVYMGVKQRKINLIFNINIDSQDYIIKANNISLSSGKLDVQIKGHKQNWQIEAGGRGIQLDKLGSFLPVSAGPLKAYLVKATVDFKAKAHGSQAYVSAAEWRLDYNNLSFSDQAAEYLGEGLAGEWVGSLRQKSGKWSGAQQVKLTKGELLTPQFYLPLVNHSVTLTTDLTYQPKGTLLTLSAVDFKHDDLSAFTGDVVLTLGSTPLIQSIAITVPPVEIAALFRTYLLPVLANPLLEDIELAGKVAIDLMRQGEKTEVAMVLDHIHIEQGLKQSGKGTGQFALYDVNGHFNWSDEKAPDSEISWRGGHLFGGITLGPAAIQMNMAGQRLTLAKSTAIPILDGKLQAEQFELTQGLKGPKVRFQGYLTPITMESISTALGWPPLSGQLSGMIPGIAYEDGVIAVEGLALVKIFDGDILIKQLKLEDLFGALPALTANLEMKNVDLETLTRTFSFGKITGKLGGRIDGLRLEDWQPVAFDARFETPADDESRHRINQKAVDNISNLGGAGVSGAISRSFLRFFEEFGYARLGISCRLERGICHMGGIEPAERGYYLVKGGGIPRIDIMGFNQKTDWHILLSKLKQISSGGAPVIE
ncbi:MAG: hypothetical protein OQK92_11315 [Sedimenticola sp.]|nr:hypothetical protein [Sedimenticola sp.]